MITKKSLYSWVWYKNTKLQVIIVGLVVITVATRVLPLEMQKRVINQAIGQSDMHALYLYSGLYIAFVVLAGILKYILNIMQSYIGQKTLLTIREELFQHVLKLPLGFYRRSSPGLVISSLTQELEGLGVFIGAAVAVPLVNILTFFAMSGYMFYLNPWLAILSISIYPLDLIVVPMVQKRYNKANSARINGQRDLAGHVGESITGIHEVQGNGSFLLEGERFGKKAYLLFHHMLWMQIYKFGIKFVNNFFQNLGPFLLFLVGGYLAIKGRFDLGALVAYLSAYEKLYDPWRELMEFYQQYQDSRVRYKQVMDYFDQEPEFLDAPEGREPYDMKGDIEVSDVVFEVNGNIRLLDRISMHLTPGEHMALVGFSGSGKSTLALNVSQLYKYTAGRVRIDGHDVSQLTKKDLAMNMAIVAQSPFIFSGTVRENLVYSCEATLLQGGAYDGQTELPPLDRLIEVVQQVGLYQDILRFGLRSVIEAGEHEDLTDHLIHARESFRERFFVDLMGDVDFFDDERFQMYTSTGLNIIFGSPNTPEYAYDTLHESETFLKFLTEMELREELEDVGEELAVRTVDIVKTVGESSDVFDQSPIQREDFDGVKELVEKLGKGGKDGLEEPDKRQLVKLGLQFIPGDHKLAGISGPTMRKLLNARKTFRTRVEEEGKNAVSFFHHEAYSYSQNIQDNIIFGKVITDSPGAEDRVNQCIMQLLIEEGVLEKVMEMGMDFEVGSMGDRLSGGQRQKVALARAFLKASPIMILDEATSALDNASQARIQSFLENRWKGRSTVISVVHRLDTLPGYDRVAVLKAGKLLEIGSYDELMAKKGALYELVNRA